MIAAVQNVSQQFRESEAYQKLPDTEEDLKKAKKSDSTMEDPFKEDAEENDGSTVSYSFGSGGYQEAVTGTTPEFTLFNLTLFFAAFLAAQFIFQAFSQKILSTDFTFS